MVAITGDDLIVRTADNRTTANTWVDYEAMAELTKFRFDKLPWDAATVDQQCTAMAMAYYDISRLNWGGELGMSQSRDYSFNGQFSSLRDPPFNDVDFQEAIGRAQAAQTLFLLQGTQVREMARAGIRMHRALTGNELEFPGYRGAVCTESLEILAPFVDMFPRGRRML